MSSPSTSRSRSRSRFPVESRREAAGLGTAVGLVVAAAVDAAFAPPGDAVGAVVAVGCFLVVAPPVYVLARTRRGERTHRLLAYVAAWAAGALVGVAGLRGWLVSTPGSAGVDAGLVSVFVGPGAWAAAAVALRFDPRRTVRAGAAAVALTALGAGGGRALAPRLVGGPGTGFAVGLAAGVVGAAAAYRYPRPADDDESGDGRDDPATDRGDEPGTGRDESRGGAETGNANRSDA